MQGAIFLLGLQKCISSWKICWTDFYTWLKLGS